MLKGKQKHFLQDLLTTELWNIAGWKKRPKLKNMFETYAIHNVLKIVNKLTKMFQIKLPKEVNKKKFPNSFFNLLSMVSFILFNSEHMFFLSHY